MRATVVERMLLALDAGPIVSNLTCLACARTSRAAVRWPWWAATCLLPAAFTATARFTMCCRSSFGEFRPRLTGARALLVHPSQKSSDGRPAPVLAVSDVGKGRSLALLTDSAWTWGFQAAGAGDDGRAFQRFWEGAIRWLVRDPALTPPARPRR